MRLISFDAIYICLQSSLEDIPFVPLACGDEDDSMGLAAYEAGSEVPNENAYKHLFSVELERILFSQNTNFPGKLQIRDVTILSPPVQVTALVGNAVIKESENSSKIPVVFVEEASLISDDFSNMTSISDTIQEEQNTLPHIPFHIVDRTILSADNQDFTSVSSVSNEESFAHVNITYL